MIEADTETGVCIVKVDGNEVADVDSVNLMKYKSYVDENQMVDKVGFDVYTCKKEGTMRYSTHLMASKVITEMVKSLV